MFFFFLLIDVFFDVESESEIHFCRSPLFLELWEKTLKNIENYCFLRSYKKISFFFNLCNFSLWYDGIHDTKTKSFQISMNNNIEE